YTARLIPFAAIMRTGGMIDVWAKPGIATIVAVAPSPVRKLLREKFISIPKYLPCSRSGPIWMERLARSIHGPTAFRWRISRMIQLHKHLAGIPACKQVEECLRRVFKTFDDGLLPLHSSVRDPLSDVPLKIVPHV